MRVAVAPWSVPAKTVTRFTSLDSLETPSPSPPRGKTCFVRGVFPRGLGGPRSTAESAFPLLYAQNRALRESRGRVLLQSWDGKDPGFGRGWVEQAIYSFDERSKAAIQLVLLTALAPYRVDEGVIQTFTTYFAEDEELLGALAWGSFTAARRIGTWLHTP